MKSSLAPDLPGADRPAPPLAPTVHHVVHGPQGERVDEYHWLRDDDAKAKRPEIMRHLEAENAYTAALLAPLLPLQNRLMAEMRSRIKDDDSSVPLYDHGWWLWREYRPGAEYPLLMRQRGTPERPDPKAPRQLLLDQNARASGQAFYRVGSTAISPNGEVLAWTEDTVGRRIHTLRFRNLRSGQEYAEAIPGVLEDLAWANDSRTIFYILQDPVTLQSGPVYRHRLGTPAEADVMVYEEADETLFVELDQSASRRYVLINIAGFDTHETRAIDADAPTTAARVVLDHAGAERVEVRARDQCGIRPQFSAAGRGEVAQVIGQCHVERIADEYPLALQCELRSSR